MTWDIAVPDEAQARRPLMSGTRPERPEPPALNWSSLAWPPPRPVDYEQAEARVQRAQGRGVHYLDFDVRVEVEQSCGPLAVQLTEMFAEGVRLVDNRFHRIFDTSPVVQLDPLHDIQQIAESVRLLRVELAKLLAPRLSQAPDGARARLAATVCDSAHGRAPVVTADDVISGMWVLRLVDHVEPVALDLAALASGQPAGRESDLDEAITEALQMSSSPGYGFVHRVAALERRLPELRSRYSSAAKTNRRASAEAAQREQVRQAEALRQLGLS